MNSFDTQLTTRLHDLADGEPGSAPPTGRLLERGRRARHRRTALAGTSFALFAVGVVAAVAVAANPADPAQRPPATAGAASSSAADPQLELVAAIRASQTTSYQVKITSKPQDNPTSPAWTTEGAFDPATDTGYLHSPYTEGPGFAEERLVGGVRYAGSAGIDQKIYWKQYPGTQDHLNYDGALNGILGASVDPDELFDALGQAGATVTQTSAGVYHFEATPTVDDGVPPTAENSGPNFDRLVGDVTLDAGKRIAKVTYLRTLTWQKPGLTKIDTAHLLVSMEFSGYGALVTVRPTEEVTVVQ
jgi:hypothetical protein